MSLPAHDNVESAFNPYNPGVFLWDIDNRIAAKRGLPSGARLFAYMDFIEK